MEFHLYTDTAGYWRWRLVAGNNRIVAASGESFYSKEDARRSAELVKTSAGGAPILG